MRALIVALVGSIAVTASTHGASFVFKPAELKLGTAPPVELAAQGCGWGSHVPAGATNEVIGIGVTVSRTEEPTAAGMRAHIILIQGWRVSPPRWGWINP